MAKTPEGLIKQAICQYLATRRDILFWVNATTGIYDPKRGIFRKNNSPYSRNGVSDILGIYQGRMLAIEVKSAVGKLTPEQREFLQEVSERGGIAFMARSVNDVIFELERQSTKESI